MEETNMLNGELTAALNDQMVFEISSAYIYLGMAAALERMNLPGCAQAGIRQLRCACGVQGRFEA